MKLKNAGITSVDELVKRLVAGEAIYTFAHVKLMYDPNNIKLDTGVSPFRYVYTSGKTEPINEAWQEFADLFVEDRWEDNIGEGVACWVSNSDPNPGFSCPLVLIIGYDKDNKAKYRSVGGVYLYATPAGEEIEKYLLKNR